MKSDSSIFWSDQDWSVLFSQHPQSQSHPPASGESTQFSAATGQMRAKANRGAMTAMTAVNPSKSIKIFQNYPNPACCLDLFISGVACVPGWRPFWSSSRQININQCVVIQGLMSAEPCFKWQTLMCIYIYIYIKRESSWPQWHNTWFPVVWGSR